MFITRKVPKKCCKIALISIFSFIFGSMITINLAPLNKTCKIENQDKEYNIMKNSKLKGPDLIILILSAPNNLDKRDIIRNTWLKLIDNIKITGRNIAIVKHYFVIGSLGLSHKELANLKTEQIKYNDVLHLPMYDGYNNLTEKVAKSFSWLNDQLDIGLNFKYILKCDDDSFVRIDNLVHELNHVEIIYIKSDIKDDTMINDNSSPYIRANFQKNKVDTNTSRGLYWGYFSGNAEVRSKGKWKETEWMLCDTYLPYALGGGYVLSKNLVVYIARNADYLRYYNSEDTSLGAWLAPVNNIVRVHDIRFDTQWASRGCWNYYLITHNISPAEIQEFYRNIVETGVMCTKEKIIRPYYLYNWLLPPSKCCNRYEVVKVV